MLCGDKGSNGRDLCDACQHDLPHAEVSCHRCAIPLPSGHGTGTICGACQTNPPAFRRCLAPFAYGAPLDHLLIDLKFNGKLSVARTLGELQADWLAKHIDEQPDCIMPVPLHPARLRERGFNQSLELARPIARRLALPLDTRSCQRQRNTSPQADLSAKHRHSNIKGAFETRGAVKGHIAIIDDVMTTGSTAEEIARTLLAAGAQAVDIWVCARADTDH